MASLPLEGLRVLDLSRLLPGPYATLVLAKLGATVDKVEDPNGGDFLRHMPPLEPDGQSALFVGLNRNKRSLALDLKSAAGRDAFMRIVPAYDVLVETFRPGVMERLGIGYGTVCAAHPRLIWCALSGYGQTGPDALRAGHDLNYLGRAGFLGASGPANAGPPLPGGQVADIGGGLVAVISILAAVQERQRTGRGKLLDVSLLESALAFSHMPLSGRMRQREEDAAPRGEDTLTGALPSYNVYETSDGKFLSVGALEPKFFTRLQQRLGIDVSAEGGDPRETLRRLFATRTRAAWMELFGDEDVCVEPIWEGHEVFMDRQLVARGAFDGGEVRIPVPGPYAPPRPAPKLGEHTREILREAGLPETG